LHDCRILSTYAVNFGIETAIKIRENASEKGLSPRANEVRRYKKKGYKRWQREKYGKGGSTERHIFCCQRIFGENVRSHKIRNSYREAKIKFGHIADKKHPIENEAIGERKLPIFFNPYSPFFTYTQIIPIFQGAFVFLESQRSPVVLFLTLNILIDVEYIFCEHFQNILEIISINLIIRSKAIKLQTSILHAESSLI